MYHFSPFAEFFNEDDRYFANQAKRFDDEQEHPRPTSPIIRIVDEQEWDDDEIPF